MFKRLLTLFDLGLKIVHLMMPYVQQLIADFGLSSRNNPVLQIRLSARSKALNTRHSLSACHAILRL